MPGWVWRLASVVLLVVMFSPFMAGCTRPDEASRVLRAQGYDQVRIEGYAFFGCGDEDLFHTEFSAVGQDGLPVAGVVCSGLFKGATVRVR